MRSNQKVKRTAVPTEDPDDTGVELNRITNSTQNNIVREGEAQKLKDGTDNELPPKLNLTDDVKKFVANNLEKNTKKIVFPAFLITGIASAILVILTYFDIIKNDLIGLIIIMALTIITAYIAMYGIYKWGEVDEYIEFAEKQNEAYQTNTGQLQTTRDRLQKEVKQMEKNVENLDAESIELKQCLKSFDELKEALEDIVDEDEEILDLIDALNQQYRDIKMMAINKDKAQLLLTYYKIKLGGANRRLFAKEDYERFIGRLNDSTRELYNKEGGFDAMDLNNDGNVDPDEFIQMTEKVLAITEDAFVALSLSPSNVNMLRQ